MDRITPEHRSWTMSRVRSTDTGPERVVRSLLHGLGFRFRLDTGKGLPGTPDIVLPAIRTTVFVHGCFWHRHRGCSLATTPKTRAEFWQSKFERNRTRDRRVVRRLKRDGWHVMIVWGCELRDRDALLARLARLRSPRTRSSVCR